MGDCIEEVIGKKQKSAEMAESALLCPAESYCQMRLQVCGGVASRDTLTGGGGGGWNLEEAGGGAIFKSC